VAPAGCVNDELLLAGVQALQQEGFQVELAPAVHDRKGYLAGDDEKRARDLEAFLLNIIKPRPKWNSSVTHFVAARKLKAKELTTKLKKGQY